MKSGQTTIYGIIMTFVSLMVMIGIYPIINDSIVDFQNMSTDSTLNTVVGLIPFFMFLGIIVGCVWYMIPHREVSYQGG